MIYQLLANNESIIDLNLGSVQGSQRNRLGKDGSLAIALALNVNKCQV